MGTTDVEVDLAVYVPRVQTGWLATDPQRRHQTVEGTLVFSDVSGFTPLTERLSRQGRVGAERLTEILNGVFGTLLGTAGRHGGDLLKFGGDALLLLFSGQGHEVRAAAAALEMQADLRAYRRLRTDVGTVSLKMSVGAASGPVQLVLVGSSHRELLAVGPVVSETARLEGAAAAGEVLLSVATAAGLPARCAGGERDGGVLLRAAPVAPAPEPPVRPDATDCARCVPESLRDHLRGAGQDGEHRLAVLAFIQFKGSDDLLEAEGVEAVTDALDHLVAAAQEACAAHDVTFLATDLDRNGGKVLLAAGAPVATPDDEDRMLFALRDIVAVESPLVIRAGVNRGYAFAVDMGAPDRRTYAVMGDATNLAARVMGRSDPGRVLATRAVLDRVGTRFALEAVEPFTVKGKSQPVSAAFVGEPLGRRRRSASLRLCGRVAEQALLERALEGARSGSGRVVEVSGEPGIGKTRLLAGLVDGADGAPVVEVGGGVYSRNSPYRALWAPFRRLLGLDQGAAEEEVEEGLRRLVADVAPELEPWIPLLGVLVGLDLAETPQVAALDPRFRAVRLCAAAQALLSALFGDALVLLVDDAQWLDEASGALLTYLANGLSARPWLLCVGRRDVDGGFRPPPGARTDRLQLGPLDGEAAEELVAAAARSVGGSLAPHVRRAVVERGAGNPLFLQELTASVVAGRDVDALPDSVENLVASCVDVLSGHDRDLLRQAAVLGSRPDRSHLAAMSGLDGAELEEAVVRLGAFLEREEEGHLAFRQAIYREVAYGSLPFRRRRQLHDRAATLLEETAADDPEAWADILSLHHSEAGNSERAWHHARIAGLRAKANAAPVDAAALFGRALDAARQLDEVPGEQVAEVCEQLGEVADLGGRPDLAATAYARARRLREGHPVAVARLAAREGTLRLRSARISEALGWFTRGHRALDALAVEDREAALVRTDLLLRAAGSRLRQGRPQASLALLDQAARRAEALGDKPMLAHAYYLLEWAHTDLGNPEAARYGTLALPIYEELGDHNGKACVLNNKGADAYFDGRWDEAISLYELSRTERALAGDLVELGTADNNIGEVLSDQGHLEPAEAAFHEALESWRPSGFHIGVGLAVSNLGRAAARVGRLDEAEVLLCEAEERLVAAGSDSLATEARAREAERRVLAGSAGALEAVEEVWARTAHHGRQQVVLAMVDRLAGYALVQAGRRAEGVSRLHQGLASARAAGAPFELALTYEALARVVPDDGSAAREAAERFRRLGVVATPVVPLPAEDAGDRAPGPSSPVAPVIGTAERSGGGR